MIGGINLEHLEIVHVYLFGGVKVLHLLLLAMALDIITGLAKAFKNGNLWSRKSLFGFTRKVMILVVIIVANIVDQLLMLDGAIVLATVLFYIVNECLSIFENLAVMGVPVPQWLAEKLKHIEETEKPTLRDEIDEELLGKKVDEELKRKGDDV